MCPGHSNQVPNGGKEWSSALEKTHPRWPGRGCSVSSGRGETLTSPAGNAVWGHTSQAESQWWKWTPVSLATDWNLSPSGFFTDTLTLTCHVLKDFKSKATRLEMLSHTRMKARPEVRRMGPTSR